MVRAWFCSIAICAIATGGLSAASTFELGFAGEVSKSGGAGAVWSDTYDATLTSTLDGRTESAGRPGMVGERERGQCVHHRCRF
jgi:hypothetical protein